MTNHDKALYPYSGLQGCGLGFEIKTPHDTTTHFPVVQEHPMAAGAGGVSALSQNHALGLPGPRCWRRIHCQRTPGAAWGVDIR